jgi:hypothetical protein
MLYRTRSKYYNCGYLTVYQATIHNRRSHYPPSESTLAETRGLSHPFSGPRLVACDLKGIKHVMRR